MLIKTDDSDTLWITCETCGTAFHPGGRCKCGNIVTVKQPNGATMIIADDSDAVVYDNE
jgi:hypothetical protein